MKFSSILGILIILIGSYCNKNTTDQIPNRPGPARKVQFRLYTDHDLSGDNHTIIFRLSIQNSKNQTLWDSLLAPMTIKNIPDSTHTIIVEKSVPGNDPSKLKVGFYYSIENVGNSWHLDSLNTIDTFK